MRLIGRAALLLPALVGLYLLAAAAGAVIPGRVQEASAKDGPPVTILLVAGPIHYDILLPLTAETRAAFAPLGPHGLPVDAPVDVYLSRHFHERRLCGLVAEPELARQVDPYKGGDVVHSSLAGRPDFSCRAAQ